MMRRTTNTEISAIRADQQVLQEVQTAQGIEQAVLSTVSPLIPPQLPLVHDRLTNNDSESPKSPKQ